MRSILALGYSVTIDATAQSAFVDMVSDTTAPYFMLADGDETQKCAKTKRMLVISKAWRTAIYKSSSRA